MERHDVDSSVIARVGYNHDARILEVEFTSGMVYDYFNVPVWVHEELVASPSLGGYFSTHIRGQYPYVKVALKPDESRSFGSR